MDVDTIKTLGTAGAGVVGAIVGTGGALFAARSQHRRTIDSEKAKEARALERRAAEKISSLVTRWADLVRQGGISGNEIASVERGYEMMRINEEMRIEALYLPTAVRARVNLARAALDEAEQLVRDGLFYETPSNIAIHVDSNTNELIAAFIRNETLPEPSEMMDHLAIALQEQDDERREEYAEELQRSHQQKRQWLVDHPEARASDPNH